MIDVGSDGTIRSNPSSDAPFVEGDHRDSGCLFPSLMVGEI